MQSTEVTASSSVSADIPDWNREAVGFFEIAPGRKLLKAVRDYQSAVSRSGVIAKLQAKLAKKRHRFWSIISGAEIPLTTNIAGGLLIPHPNGIVIHPDAVIGPNCLLFQQVTLGTAGGVPPPHLEGHVDVGAGAKILGPVRIGRHAKIGANAVVLKDVPAEATAVGIPAHVIAKP